jgi:DNA ligase (NAD+)
MNADIAVLKEIDGIGDVLAANIHQFMIEDGQYWFDKMTEIGLQLEATEEENPNVDANGVGPVLEGLKIVFSGSSKYFPGDTSEDFLESFGAKCGHSVSRKTNYLVIGENPGPKKLQTAKDYGIEIVPEDDFYKRFGLNVG